MTYRIIVMCADAIAILILTGAWRIALGFMVVSNNCTTALYFLHERAWARVGWGLDRPVRTQAKAGKPAEPAA